MSSLRLAMKRSLDELSTKNPSSIEKTESSSSGKKQKAKRKNTASRATTDKPTTKVDRAKAKPKPQSKAPRSNKRDDTSASGGEKMPSASEANMPPMPVQKYPIGTMISKTFVDPQTDKPRQYEAKVKKYEYVPDKKKWLYYVYYETDEEGEHITEHSVGKNRTVESAHPGELFATYFSSMFALCNEPPTVNWKDFLRDLRQQPEMADIPDFASGSHATSGAYPLQYALRFPDVPLCVIEELIDLNPSALNWYEEDFGWNTMHWMIILNDRIANINPLILRLVLREGDTKWAITEGGEGYSDDSRPIDWFIRMCGPSSEQVKAILYSSPNAVAWVIFGILTGTEKASPELVTTVLEAAYQWELDFSRDASNGFFNATLIGCAFDCEDSENEDYGPRLLDVLLKKNAAKEKVTLLRRILKIKARAIRENRKEKFGPLLDISVDTTSLTCCVLLCLAEWDRIDLWESFAFTFKDELTKPTRDGSQPLVTAIRLGYQWNPVLKSLVEADRQTIELLECKHRLPPFLTAATVSYDWYRLDMGLRGDSYNSRDKYTTLNSVNNAMELLRMNPNMIRHDLISNPAAMAKKKAKKKKS